MKAKFKIGGLQVIIDSSRIEFDAEPSLGEDLADISALYICDTYLLDFNKKIKVCAY